MTIRNPGPPPMRHGQRRRRSLPGLIAKTFLGVVASVAVGALAATGYAAVDLNSLITSRGVDIGRTQDYDAVQAAKFEGPLNMLIVGSDSGGGNKIYKRDGENLADVTILLHISGDRKHATAVSIPRDTIMSLPACSGYGRDRFNASLRGGLGCTVQAAEKLTGGSIPYAALLQFDSVVEITKAIGGVPVCLASPIHDRYTGINLSAGNHVIQGADALAFVRSRHGVGDGSDLGRIRNQQGFLASMQRKIQGMDLKSNPALLLRLGRTLLQNTTLSNSLASISQVLGLMQAINQVGSKNFVLLRYPTVLQQNVVVPQEPQASELNAALAADRAITLSNTASPGLGVELHSIAPETASASDTETASATAPASEMAVAIDGVGQTGDEQACAVANHG